MITVDSNAGENPLFEALSAELGDRVELQRKPLPLGDIDLSVSDFRLVLERKSIADLEASLVDGRYKSQMDRARDMVRENPGVKFGLLIVGDIPEFNSKPRSIPASTIYAVLSKLQIRDGFIVLAAKSTKDAASIVAQTAKHALNGAFSSNGPPREAGSVLGKRPRDKQLPPLAMALASVRGVSPATATALAERFETASALVSATERDISEVRAGKRSVGPTVAARVKQVFC